MSAADGAKVAVTEFYLQTAHWPASNQEAGLPGAERFRGLSLTGLARSAGGVITVTYDAHSGVGGGTLQLRPRANETSSNVAWPA